jgi:hypothetical protein
MAVEQLGDNRVFTVSTQNGGPYDPKRHIYSNFNRVKFVDEVERLMKHAEERKITQVCGSFMYSSFFMSIDLCWL